MKLVFILLWVHVGDEYNDYLHIWVPLSWFLLRHQQFYPAKFLQHQCKWQKNVGRGQSMRFKTAIQYFKVLWIFQQYLFVCQVFTKKKRSFLLISWCWDQENISKTANPAIAVDHLFVRQMCNSAHKIITQPSGLQLNL